jgi:hypothetical protein
MPILAGKVFMITVEKYLSILGGRYINCFGVIIINPM